MDFPAAVAAAPALAVMPVIWFAGYARVHSRPAGDVLPAVNVRLIIAVDPCPAVVEDKFRLGLCAEAVWSPPARTNQRINGADEVSRRASFRVPGIVHDADAQGREGKSYRYLRAPFSLTVASRSGVMKESIDLYKNSARSVDMYLAPQSQLCTQDPGRESEYCQYWLGQPCDFSPINREYLRVGGGS